MKKRLINFLLIISSLFISCDIVNASSATIKSSATSSQILTGKTVNVTIETTSTDVIGAVEYSLSYDNKVLKLTDSPSNCSSSYCIWHTATGKETTQSYSFTFKAIGSGTTTVDVTEARVIDYNLKEMSVTSKGSQIKVITEEDLQASYSSNNYLSSLKVSGYKLSPSFNKETTKYTLELDETVEKIKITATAEDTKSTLTGTGSKKVSEGENKLKVVVTAENGSKKTYTITATVKSLNPINVTVDDIDYTVVKKSANLPTVDNYTLSEIEINENKIPAYTSTITNQTLVGLKDKEGNISLFIYDIDKDTYTKYVELKFNGTTIQLIDN